MLERNAQEISLLRSLRNIHPECEQSTCVVHAPSNHHMRSLPLSWDPEVKLFMRVCEHDVEHPDPDQYAYLNATNRRYLRLHNCCGGDCCTPPGER